MYDPYAGFKKYVLSNGLHVYHQFLDRPWVGVEMIVHSASREDPLHLPGLAHFLEHVINQNVPNYTTTAFNEFFDSIGARISRGTTSYYATRFKFGIPADQELLQKSLAIFGSMLLLEKIEEGIERERQVVQQEFNEKYSSFERLEWDTDYRKIVFRGHRLEKWNSPLGRPEGFLAATKNDLQSYYDKHYAPKNMSIVILGGFQVLEILDVILKSPFGMAIPGERNPLPKPITELPFMIEHMRTVKMSDFSSFKLNRTEYSASWAFPAWFSRYAVQIFNGMLGQILFDEIREKRGLAYQIGVHSRSFHDIHEYEISGLVNSNATDVINSHVRECIQMIPKRQDLFERILKSKIQQFKMVDVSGAELLYSSGTQLVLHNRILPLQENLDELQKVTFEQVVEVVGFLQPHNQYTFIVRP